MKIKHPFYIVLENSFIALKPALWIFKWVLYTAYNIFYKSVTHFNKSFFLMKDNWIN